MVVYVPLREFFAAGASAAQSFASAMLPSKGFGKREENQIFHVLCGNDELIGI